MAYKRNIGLADGVFFDTDMDLPPFQVYDGNPTQAQMDAGTVTPVDAAGWAFTFTVRTQVDTPDPPLIEKTSGSPAAILVTGTFDNDPAVNTQAVVVSLVDTDTYDPDVSPAVEIDAGKYYYALKRVDAGFETIIAYGTFRLQRVAVWE